MRGTKAAASDTRARTRGILAFGHRCLLITEVWEIGLSDALQQSFLPDSQKSNSAWQDYFGIGFSGLFMQGVSRSRKSKVREAFSCRRTGMAGNFGCGISDFGFEGDSDGRKRE